MPLATALPRAEDLPAIKVELIEISPAPVMGIDELGPRRVGEQIDQYRVADVECFSPVSG